MIKLYPVFWIGLLFGLPLMPVLGVPPIRCVRQTTGVKDGKAITHLILTTAKIGELQTAKNTADVLFPGRMGSIVTNADQTLAAITTSSDVGQEIYHTSLYLFVSTARQNLYVIPNFQQRVAKALLGDPLRTARNTFLGRDYWSYYGGPRQSQPSKAERQEFLRLWRKEVYEDFQHELSVSKIDGNLLSMRADKAEVNEIFFSIRRQPGGKLTVIACGSEGE